MGRRQTKDWSRDRLQSSAGPQEVLTGDSRSIADGCWRRGVRRRAVGLVAGDGAGAGPAAGLEERVGPRRAQVPRGAPRSGVHERGRGQPCRYGGCGSQDGGRPTGWAVRLGSYEGSLVGLRSRPRREVGRGGAASRVHHSGPAPGRREAAVQARARLPDGAPDAWAEAHRSCRAACGGASWAHPRPGCSSVVRAAPSAAVNRSGLARRHGTGGQPSARGGAPERAGSCQVPGTGRSPDARSGRADWWVRARMWAVAVGRLRAAAGVACQVPARVGRCTAFARWVPVRRVRSRDGWTWLEGLGLVVAARVWVGAGGRGGAVGSPAGGCRVGVSGPRTRWVTGLEGVGRRTSGCGGEDGCCRSVAVEELHCVCALGVGSACQVQGRGGGDLIGAVGRALGDDAGCRLVALEPPHLAAWRTRGGS